MSGHVHDTDFCEIWHDDAYWPLAADQSLKFWTFEKKQDGGGRHSKKSQKSRYLRNLVRWCKMCLLTAPTVKKIEFHKSNMADGRHFKNR